MTRRWVLVRHGESVANHEGWLSGSTVDTPLTERGLAQARAVGAAVAEVPISSAWSSDLQRATDTAREILAGRHVRCVALAGLRERDLGDWAGRRVAELRATGLMEVLTGWTSRPPGGESHDDLARRALGTLAEVDLALPPASASDGAHLVVAHGGLLRAVVGLVDGLPREAIGSWRIANATPLVRDLPVGRWHELLEAL